MFSRKRRPRIPTGLVRLTQVLAEDSSLRAWFLSMEMFSESLRCAAFKQMAEKIRTNGDDTELAAAVAALDRPEAV